MARILKFLFLNIIGVIGLGFFLIYISFNKSIPEGTSGKEADELAQKMLEAIDYEAYKNTKFLSWTFKYKNHYVWNKELNIVKVTIDDEVVELNLNDPDQSTYFIDKKEQTGKVKKDAIAFALKNFNNDSFWLVAPYKVFDPGVERKIITSPNHNEKALLVTYTNGGTTPGDSYLWRLNNEYIPISFQMWVSIIPINGLNATWEKWITTESGAYLSQKHKIMGLVNIPIENIRAWNE